MGGAATMSKRDQARITETDDGDQVVWGVPAIAKVINKSAAQTYYLLEQGYLDGYVKKLSPKLTAGRLSKLREFPF
jgi:hypothetical protein